MDNSFCFFFKPTGDNRMKDDWTRGGGMNIPRMRRPEDQSATAGLMMEVVRQYYFVNLTYVRDSLFHFIPRLRNRVRTRSSTFLRS